MQESGPKTLHNVENPDMISQLIEECGYFVNARNENDDTPLHVMSRKNNLDCGMALIINGADINMLDKVEKFSKRTKTSSLIEKSIRVTIAKKWGKFKGWH